MTFGFGPIEKLKLYKAPHLGAKVERPPRAKLGFVALGSRLS
jgi:hypothetical protein